MSFHSKVAEVAHELYEKSGRIHGHDLEHWLEAEKIVSERDYVREQSVRGKEKKSVQPKKAESSRRNGGKEKSKASKPKGTRHDEKQENTLCQRQLK